ncbi:ImpE protein [compost metagenome]
MTAEELLRAGQPGPALQALQDRVRAEPGNAALRIFLFQLLAVMGQLARARNQLKVAGDLDAGALAMVQTYNAALDCEALRVEVFAGRLTPLLMGEPEQWLALLIQALQLDADGRADAADQLRDQAFEAAPAIAGRINGEPFGWCADADPRLGPVLEVIINGRYAWLPMAHVASLRCEAPEDLRDLVWMPAELTLRNGGATVALIPSRYPDTLAAGDDAALLGRRIDWLENGVPIGQRLFATDKGETALFELRSLEFDHRDG